MSKAILPADQSLREMLSDSDRTTYEAALTKLDVLSGLEKLRVGTSYRIFDQPVVDFPCCVDELARCEYDHIELPGWQEDITGVREFADLPETARAYVDRLEELVGVPIRMISVGPSREQIILRSDPFIGRGSA